MKRVFAIGNALVDHEYEVTDDALAKTGLAKGNMTLASLSEQAALKQVLSQQNATQTKMAGGGSAANTAFAIAALGGSASLACRVNADAAGRFYLNDLHEAGVTTSNASLGQSSQPTGSCVVMVSPDAERTMQTHLGAASELNYENIDTELLESADYLYIEGYLAASADAVEALKLLRARAQELGIKTALSFADPSMVKFCKDGLNTILCTDNGSVSGVDVLFCNLEEACVFTETDSKEAALNKLHEVSDIVVITLGADGAFVGKRGEVAFVAPAVPVDTVIDTNGAGDNYAGGFMYALSVGSGLRQCATMASRVAGALIQTYGPRLTVAEYEALVRRIS